MAEHLTFNQRADSSNLSGLTLRAWLYQALSYLTHLLTYLRKRFRVVHGYPVVVVDRDVAALLERHQHLVHASERSPDQARQLALGQPNWDQNISVGFLLPVLVGEGQDLPGRATRHVLRRKRLNVSVGHAQPAGKHAHQV